MLELKNVSKVYAPGTVNEHVLFRHFDLTVYDPRYSDLRAADLAPESFDAVILLFGADTIATTGLDF